MAFSPLIKFIKLSNFRNIASSGQSALATVYILVINSLKSVILISTYNAAMAKTKGYNCMARNGCYTN